jgi:hypothetical protein
LNKYVFDIDLKTSTKILQKNKLKYITIIF